MRKCVEGISPNNPMDILIAPRVVMRIDPEYEAMRFWFMKDMLEKHAVFFKPSVYDYRYPHFDLGGRCYDQAMEVAISCNLTYCEGVMIARVPHGYLPMPHAWCVTDDGRLIDPTAHKIQHVDSLAYWGIKFKNSYAVQWEKKYGFHGMLDGHPDLGDTVGVYVDPIEEWKA